MNSRLCTSSYIIIHHHTRSSLSPSSILWIQVSRQSSPVEPLTGSQSSLSLLSGQDSPTLSNLYLGLQGSPSLPSSQLLQNRFRRIYTSGPIVLGNPQRPVPSSLALLVPDLRHDNEADDCTREEVWLRPTDQSLPATY